MKNLVSDKIVHTLAVLFTHISSKREHGFLTVSRFFFFGRSAYGELRWDNEKGDGKMLLKIGKKIVRRVNVKSVEGVSSWAIKFAEEAEDRMKGRKNLIGGGWIRRESDPHKRISVEKIRLQNVDLLEEDLYLDWV